VAALAVLAEVIIIVDHQLKSGQLAGLPPILFGLTNVSDQQG